MDCFWSGFELLVRLLAGVSGVPAAKTVLEVEDSLSFFPWAEDSILLCFLFFFLGWALFISWMKTASTFAFFFFLAILCL